MAYFPSTPGFTGLLRPIRLEGDILDLELEGEVPVQLNGTYHRVQPDAQFPPRFENDQFFNGDGLVALFRFHDGKIDFKQRYAETDKFKLERTAGKALFGAYRNPLTDDPSVEGQIRGTANTNVIVHGGKLLALKEDSPPLVMDPLTLETTEGYIDFNGKMASQTFCAHPKIDPDTGNMCAFSYASTGLLTEDCSYMEISPDGELLFETAFKAPYYCMMHDFAITENYAVFHIVPIVSNWERLQQEKPHFAFDPSLPVWVGILPRKGTAAEMRWFKAPKTVFASHVLNAYEEGSKVHFFTPQAEGNCFPFFPDINDAPFDPKAAQPFLHRWTFDMGSDGNDFAEIEKVTDMVGEFPRIDDRFAGKKTRYGWMPVMDRSMPFETGQARATGFILNKIGFMDFETGKQTSWWPGPQSLCQEPCFVPRTPDAPEGDGYIISIVDNVVTNYSDLVILDALDIEKGPIARAKLPLRMRSGLHGNWADISQIVR